MPSNTGPTEHHAFYGNGATTALTSVDMTGENASSSNSADSFYLPTFTTGDSYTVMVCCVLTPEIQWHYPAGCEIQRIRRPAAHCLKQRCTYSLTGHRPGRL